MSRAFTISAILVPFVVMVGYGLALAQSGKHGDGHAEMHPVYEDWKMPGTSYGCCDNGDCRPTRAYVDDQGRWRALADGTWIVIPPDALLHVPSPDGRSHLCMSEGAQLPRCFVAGEPRS